jgi:hypothetical protein
MKHYEDLPQVSQQAGSIKLIEHAIKSTVNNLQFFTTM